jgi:hypothetical protein
MANTLHKFRFRHWKGIYLNSYIRRMFGTYRLTLEQFADTYMKKDKPDSAGKWLKWGRNNLPFYPKIGTNEEEVQYAYSFAQAGDSKNALEMVDESRGRTFSNLKYYFKKYTDIRNQAMKMRNDAKKAQSSGDTKKQQHLNDQTRKLSSNIQDIGQKLRGTYQNLVYIQRIYYMTGKKKKAKQLASKVDDITNGMIKLPENKKKSKKSSKKARKKTGKAGKDTAK